MWRYLVLGGILIGAATQLPAYLQSQIEAGDEPSRQTRQSRDVARDVPRVAMARQDDEKHNPLAGRVARIGQDRSGHYLARARMNGRSFEVLVDTGATMVAINESTARRLGIRLSNNDFRYRVNTANGVAEAARAMIDEIEIGRVIVHDVQATVTRDASLDGILLGMSFLNRLKKFEFDAGTLVLTQ